MDLDGLKLAVIEHPRSTAARRALLQICAQGADVTLLAASAERYSGWERQFSTIGTQGALRVAAAQTSSAEDLLRPTSNCHVVISFSHHYCAIAETVRRLRGDSESDAVARAHDKRRFREALSGRPYSLKFATAESSDRAEELFGSFEEIGRASCRERVLWVTGVQTCALPIS